MIPLILRLKREEYRKVAKSQDIIVETLYRVFARAVLHGGTAIWRCYKGRRFSEDIDVYIPRDLNKINKFFSLLEKKGFVIEKKKIGENSIYSSLRIDRIIVRFEALFKKIKGSLKEYETAEGNIITVYTLTKEEIIKEKISAYLKRLKIRDLYDIFFLLQYLETKTLKKDLKNLLSQFKRPSDEKDLGVFIYEGVIPSTDDMLAYIKRKLEHG